MRIAHLVVLSILGCQGGGGSGEPESAPTGSPSPSTTQMAATAAPEPPAPTSAVPAAGGPAVTHDSYLVEITPRGEVTTNQEGRVDVRLVPKEGWHVNAEYPIRLQVQAPQDVTLARSEFDRAAAEEFGDPLAVFAVKFTATAPGEKAFEGDFRFSVCNPQTCLLERQQLRWSVSAR